MNFYRLIYHKRVNRALGWKKRRKRLKEAKMNFLKELEEFGRKEKDTKDDVQ